MKTKVLFVCLGNICRSPGAEGIMLRKIKEKGLEEKFEVDSAGTSGYHRGELPDSRMRHYASKRGYDLTHLSRPVTVEDFERFDIIVGMDDNNIYNLKDMAPTVEDEKKIVRMTDFCTNIRTCCVPDPYYGGSEGFEHVLDILEDACEGLINYVVKEKGE